MNDSEVCLEVAGPAAMFTRPDTGATPISYPVPTYSAAKGMFEAVARLRSAYISPTGVEVCRPIRYERYVTNYGGPLRKASQIKGDNNYQLIATILVDVCYRIHGEVCGKRSTRGQHSGRARRKRSGRDDSCRKLREMFGERLRNGQTFYTPCLGWSEFVPSYFGPPRADTEPDKSVNLIIPSLLHSMWQNRQLCPTFRQNVELREGVLSYAQGEIIHAE
jgi:CRISPR-associated protein Cas5d